MNTENLKKARARSGMTMQQVGEAIGASKSTYKNYEYGTREPNGDTIVELANLFDVTTDYLLGREPAPNPFADLNLSEDDEKEVVDKYMSLPPEIRACMLDVLIQLGDAARHRQAAAKVQPEIPTWSICYNEYKVSAGTGVMLDEYERLDRIDVIDTPEARRADYGLMISGDSMEPTYHDGDIVLVKQTNIIDVGEIGIFVVDNEGYIKEFGGDRLISLNDDYDDILLHEYNSIKCCGRVIGIAELPE